MEQKSLKFLSLANLYLVVADSVPVVTVQAPAIDSSQSQSGFVDKAMANAKGIIDTLWNAVPSPGGTSK